MSDYLLAYWLLTAVKHRQETINATVPSPYGWYVRPQDLMEIKLLKLKILKENYLNLLRQSNILNLMLPYRPTGCCITVFLSLHLPALNDWKAYILSLYFMSYLVPLDSLLLNFNRRILSFPAMFIYKLLSCSVLPSAIRQSNVILQLTNTVLPGNICT